YAGSRLLPASGHKYNSALSHIQRPPKSVRLVPWKNVSGILRYAGHKPSLVSSDFRSENNTSGSFVVPVVAPAGELRMHLPGEPVPLLQNKKRPLQEAGKKASHAVFYAEMEQLWKTVCAKRYQKY